MEQTHGIYINRYASSRLFALRILKPILDHSKWRSVYYGLILSVIEYCSPLLVGMSTQNSEVLQNIQRRAHRIVCGSSSMCECNQFPDLQTRRKEAAIKLLVQISGNPAHPLHSLCPPRSYRTGRFIQPQTRSTRRRNSYFPKTTIIMNGIYTD